MLCAPLTSSPPRVAARDVPAAALAHQIKQRLRDAVGDHNTCSIGYAPNRWLAKIAADRDKPDGLTVLCRSARAAVWSVNDIHKLIY